MAGKVQMLGYCKGWEVHMFAGTAYLILRTPEGNVKIYDSQMAFYGAWYEWEDFRKDCAKRGEVVALS